MRLLRRANRASLMAELADQVEGRVGNLRPATA